MMGLGRAIQRAAPTAYVGNTQWNHPGQVGGALPSNYPPYTPGMGWEAPVEYNDMRVIGLSAAWRCLHILTDGIGSLMLNAIDDREDDRRIETPRQLADPWPMMSPVEWRAMVTSSLVMHGNAYLLPVDEDPRTGYPRQLPIVHPDRIHISMNDGRPRYHIDDLDSEPVECLHIRGYTAPGDVRGIGVVEAMRRGIRLANDIETYQTGNLETASVPPVVIRVNRPEISQEQATDIQRRWVARHGWASRTPAVLPTSLEVTPIAWSPEDTQFLESKQFMAVEICWWFGIDPKLLGLAASGQSLTYSNVETTYVDLQRMSFQPWTSRIESALSRVLPRHQIAKFDFSPMLRTTLQDRYASYQIGIESGFLEIDEVRQLENLGPIGSADPSMAPDIDATDKSVNDSLPTTDSEVIA